MRLRTWQIEAAVVALVLSAVGVLGTFLHAQVADRMAEAEAARPAPTVACHRYAGRYFVLREVAWFAYFATGRCWSALVGCALFLVYPIWRRWWRATPG